MCLELETPLAVEKQILREPHPILPKLERIVAHCPPMEKRLSKWALFSRRRINDPIRRRRCRGCCSQVRGRSLLGRGLVNICIRILEPVLELPVTLSAIDQRVRSIKYNIQTLHISEPFEEGVQLRRNRLKIIVRSQSSATVFTVISDVFPMLGIVFDKR